jgi:hypothetical protein
MDRLATTISPNASHCGQTVKLGTIDQIAPRDYTTTLNFFRLKPKVDHTRIFRNLQTGLLHATREIPQLLTCVRKCDNDREELELVYSLGNGACIFFRDYTSPSLKDQWPSGSFDDLEREHFPLAKLPGRLVHGFSELNDGLIPCLIVQANFIAGGLIVSACVQVRCTQQGPSEKS